MADGPTTNPDAELLPVTGEDHVRGSEQAAVTLVEFGDYECPGCGEAYLVIQRLESDLGDALRFVFRHFPYAGLHPHAELAAQASEAASAQGRFWEMHDLLFEHQQALEFDDLVRYARQISLDVERFHDELKSEKYLERVRSDFRSGVQNGVFGTPAIFLNGIRHNEGSSYETLSAAIARILEQSSPAEITKK
jgi:protein-disulfide isomerase